MPIGPALPPHLAHLAAASSRSPSASPPPGPSVPAGPAVLVDKEEEEEEYVPALPPHLLAARKARASSSGVEKKAASPSIGTSVGPSVGTTLPAAGLSRPSSVPSPSFPEDYDSDDEVIGPVPVPTAGGEEDDDEAQAAVREFLEREERRRKQAEEKDKPKALQREEWMLVPPSSGVLSNVDPLKKRATTFSRSTAQPETDSSVWTETPAEKAQRIADEVAGVKRKKDKAGDRILTFEEEEEDRRKRRRDMEIKQELHKYNRGPSLLNQHADKLAKKKQNGEDDDAPAIWDHDRDMGVTGRLLTDQERSRKIKEARGLGDRFGHGKGGAYQI
ncbi:hypothetical protein I314_05792 [Cryptococcus bacillisporus CA1873]|uniref:DUF3752 domain-containing protein n=1 Tax=Cryptococcus bacillisporus CA1873 TaxID=1296111 RepID=A0ABR5B4M8_CRYGA|nr:hypothetical protein I314_05792 [Cryptococcus bacillisporus CA1873]|eukprot:KIR58544.1 hypothetical protein I314_05792 [Cryptococcus gattii CA1873]